MMSSRRETRLNPHSETANGGKVVDARGTLKAMEAAKAKLEERQTAITREREQLAGAALIDRDADASKRLQELTTEAASVAVSLENMAAAVKAAQSRLRDAEAAEAQLRERENVRQATLLLEERHRLAGEAQKALDDFNRIMSQIIQRGRELRTLSPRAASERHDGLILRASMQNARCALHRLGLLSSEPLPIEALRVSLPEMLAHIDAGAYQWCDRVVGENAKRSAV